MVVLSKSEEELEGKGYKEGKAKSGMGEEGWNDEREVAVEVEGEEGEGCGDRWGGE